MSSFTLFPTAIGACGIVWGETGLIGTLLPEISEARARARILRRRPDAIERNVPPEHDGVVSRITALLGGRADDLMDIPLDMTGIDDFARGVYLVARAIPIGATLTYGEVALALGSKDKAREVGQALGRNPFPIIVPCHRVLAAGGGIGGFSAPGGIETKRRLLALENRIAPPAPRNGQLTLI